MPQSKFRLLLITTIVGVVYYFLTRLSIVLSTPPEHIASFWLPNTVILATLLLIDKRYWWIFILVLAPANMIPNLQADHTLTRVFIFYLANATEVLVAAFALKPILGNNIRLDQFREMILFLLWAILIAPACSAFISSIVTFYETGMAYWLVWRAWFLSDALAHLALTPAIILFVSSGLGWMRKESFARFGEALILVLCLFIVGFLVLGTDAANNFPALLFTPIPIFLWVSLRFGPRGISAAVLIITLLTVWNAANGRGAFTTSLPADNALSLQLFLFAISVPMMLLSSLFSQYKKTEKILRESNERFRASFENASIGMVLVSLDHKIIEANQALYNMLGYTQDQLSGSPFKGITHADDVNKSINYHEKLISGEIESYSFEKRYIHRHGHNI